MSDSAIGIIRDISGAMSVIPVPRTGRILYPRIAAARNGWHLLFVTGTEGVPPRDPIAIDTGSLWYAQFDGRLWSEPTRIMPLHTAYMLPGFASQAVADGDDVAFAFGYDGHDDDQPGSNPKATGAIFVRIRSGQWRVDTLPTWAAPRYVQLAKAVDRQFKVAMVHSYFDRRVSAVHQPALFVATHGQQWSSETLASTTDEAIAFPNLGAIGDSILLSWQQYEAGRRSFTINWASAKQMPLSSAHRVGIGDGFDRAGLVLLHDSLSLWFTRSGSSRTDIQAVLRRNTATVNLGTFHAPLYNASPAPVRMSDSTVGVITIALDTADQSSPRAWSVFTHLRVACP